MYVCDAIIPQDCILNTMMLCYVMFVELVDASYILVVVVVVVVVFDGVLS